MSARRTILCLCTGNTCRSPMLAALLRDELSAGNQSDIAVLSAGVAAAAGQPASRHAITAMHDRGLDLTDHQSTPMQLIDLDSVDEIWCMGAGHAAFAEAAGVPLERIRVVAEASGGVPDPYGGDLAEYRATAQVLSSAAAEIARNQPLG